MLVQRIENNQWTFWWTTTFWFIQTSTLKKIRNFEKNRKFRKKTEIFSPFGSYLQVSNSLVTRKDDIWRQILHIVMASFGQSPNHIHKGCVRKYLVRLCILVVPVGLASRTWQIHRYIGHHILGGHIFGNPLEIILIWFIW